jgi:thiol:disulfide interchange protein
MTSLRRLLACSAALVLAASVAHAADWTEDYASAIAQAKKEHKLVLLDFTGSDWCVWCQRTDKEVFATQKFKDFADQKLILVKLDFPNAKPQTDALKAQNAGLRDKYGVEGYPTLVVLDAKEKVVFSQLGYKDGGPDALIAQFPKAAN